MAKLILRIITSLIIQRFNWTLWLEHFCHCGTSLLVKHDWFQHNNEFWSLSYERCRNGRRQALRLTLQHDIPYLCGDWVNCFFYYIKQTIRKTLKRADVHHTYGAFIDTFGAGFADKHLV